MADINSPEEAKQELKEQAEKLKKEAEEKGEQFWAHMAETMEDLRGNANVWMKSFTNCIKSNPMQSIATASLIGFLVGTLCNKSKK